MTAVIVTLIFYACGSIDESTTSDVPSGRAVITVNTADIYEESGIVDIIARNLPDNMSITDTVLIYNKSGRLVTKLGTVTKSLEPQTIVVDDLPYGTYTFVLWQTGYMVDETESYKTFVLADEEDLSTVKLLHSYLDHIVADANGLASATITVNENTFETTVTPKLVGSIFYLKSEKAPRDYGFEEIDVHRMDLMTKGFYLDPARSEDDRWITGNHETEPIPFAYIENDVTQFHYYTLEQGDDIQLSVVTWKPVGDDYEEDEIIKSGHHKLPNGSNMTYYFDVDRTSYQPPFFGPDDQLPAWKADRDAGILVNDPYLKWGGNLEEVEAHIRAKQFWAEGNNQLLLWEGWGWHMWYYVAPDLTEQYIFETEDGRNLTKAMCMCHDSTLPIDIFTKSLVLQGYTYLGKLHYPDTEDYDDLFLSADGKTEVMVYANPYGGWVIDYFPYDPEDFNHIVKCKTKSQTSLRRLRSTQHSLLKKKLATINARNF